ncbi:hypothetical protein LCGC14_2686990 [marine sediment metagenome]|uniref:C2H2-type domain-containing protein n=1 Tax=marine sediment metagenome TaxID=412755 RepID=A0A0F9A751_9ZZZZ
MTEPTTTERRRDLRNEATGLGGLEKDVVFQHIRTRRELVTLYRMADGQPVEIPEYMVAGVMQKKNADGWMFTEVKDEAPDYKVGEIKCFLHAESPERESGLLQEWGLSGKKCPAGNLSSEYSKTQHGERRHKQEWAAKEAFEEAKEKQEDRDAQREQLNATLALAGKAAPTATRVAVNCPTCNKPCKGNAGLSAHVRGAHGDASE